MVFASHPLYHKGGFLILFCRYLIVLLLFIVGCFSVVSNGSLDRFTEPLVFFFLIKI